MDHRRKTWLEIIVNSLFWVLSSAVAELALVALVLTWPGKG